MAPPPVPPALTLDHMAFRYVIVDVFSARALAGNALCVVLDPVPAPMQPAIAREVNLSETTFPVVIADGEYEVRIYTPSVELPFAGHPTLGTAWVLGQGTWKQHSAGGIVPVEVAGDHAVMTQPEPTFSNADPSLFAEALRLPRADAAVVGEVAGIRHVVVATDGRLDRLAPDLRAVSAAARTVNASGVAAVRRLDDATLHVRVFVPGVGVAEDPATGSAAGLVGVVARRHWRTNVDVVVHQGQEIGRPSLIEVHADAADLRVGGAVTRCAEGRFLL